MSQRHPGPTTRDVELARISLSSHKWSKSVEFATTVFRVGGVVVSVGLIMAGLQAIVLAQPDQISALAKLTEAINMGTVTGYAAGAVGVGAYVRERKGKKRAIKQLGEMRKRVEENDEGGRTSSHLTDTGDTPEELR